MAVTFLRIIAWNANGLNARAQELDVFLRINNIDVALISETHFTEKNFIKIMGYKAYWTLHPSGRARGGTAILIKQNILHFQQEEIKEAFMQATIITINHGGAELSLGAIYCPPRHNIARNQYVSIFNKLGPRFIIGGDYNVKHTAWGSRLITPGKGKELLSAIEISGCEYHSSRKPTYWPTDINKVPDLIDFYISKGIASNYIEVEGIEDLTSDHTPVLMTLSTLVIKKKRKLNLTNKYTDWESFREKLDNLIELKVSLKTKQELEIQAGYFINSMREAAKEATPVLGEKVVQEVNYPMEIRELIKERRRKRRVWHRTRNIIDKREFSRVSNKVNRLIKEHKEACTENYLRGLFSLESY